MKNQAQVSIDLLFAIVLVSFTVIGLISWGLNQATGTSIIGNSAYVKMFAIDVRDSVAKVYAHGPGFEVVKSLPFNLSSGDWVRVELSSNGTLLVVAQIDGTEYIVSQRLQVPVGVDSNVTLTPGNETFIIRALRLTDGGTGVVVEP